VRLRHGPRSRRVAIIGLDPSPTLMRVVDADMRPVGLPSQGLLLSEALASILAAGPGDVLDVEVLEGNRPVRSVAVGALVRDYGGTSAWMRRDVLHRLAGEGECLSGAFLRVDADRTDALYGALKQAPRVATVTVKEAALESFEATMAENILRMRAFNVAFAVIIAFGVVYNAARISLAERGREMATLRVMGFTRGEISGILLGELAVLTVAALPIGLLLGYGLSALAVAALATETQRFPLVVEPSTFASAALVVLVAAALSAVVVRRRLDRLDLVSVLKERE
jgi:putative ABC transport system permease protein